MSPAAVDSAKEVETAARLRMALGRLSRLLRPTGAASAAGLSPTRVSVLLTIVRTGPLRLGDLADTEGLNPTMLSRVVADFSDAGLVRRSSDPDDRRSAWVEATTAGRRLAERMRRERTEAVDRALHELSDRDRRAIERALPALEQLADALRQARS